MNLYTLICINAPPRPKCTIFTSDHVYIRVCICVYVCVHVLASLHYNVLPKSRGPPWNPPSPLLTSLLLLPTLADTGKSVITGASEDGGESSPPSSSSCFLRVSATAPPSAVRASVRVALWNRSGIIVSPYESTPGLAQSRNTRPRSSSVLYIHSSSAGIASPLKYYVIHVLESQRKPIICLE